MSMDFRKHTYRPSRTDSRFRTNYAQMSQWMLQVGNRNKKQQQKDAMTGGPQSAVYGKKLNDCAKGAAIDESVPPHLRFAESGGYDDFHKAFRAISTQWPNAKFPTFGPPRLRHGRAGGSWRHVKEVLQAGGHRIVFVDGQIRWDDTNLLDSVPGGNLIHPDQNRDAPRGMVSSGMMDNRRSCTGLRREKKSNKISASTYGVETKRGLEHNNWNVIR